MDAAPEQLQEVWNSLSNTDDAEVVVRLLRVFSNRALPQFDARLIDLCLHDHEPVRRWAFAALSKNSHPQVRQFALRSVRESSADGPRIRLLVCNFCSGDEQLILENIELPEDADQRHWLLGEVLDVLEENPTSDSTVLGQIIYAETPCTHCRGEALKLLLRDKAAPDWMMTECVDDADNRCRTLVAEKSGYLEGDAVS